MEEALEQADEDLAAEAERKRLEEAARRARLKANAEYNTRTLDPFSVLDIAPPASTSCGPATLKQCELLLKFGIDARSMTKDQASRIQKEVFRRLKSGLCTLKQAKHLKKNGYSTEVSKKEASIILDRLWGHSNASS